MLAGVALGYRWRAFRVEGEYFYRTTTYDDRSIPLVSSGPLEDKASKELDIEGGGVTSGVDDVLSHNFFANLYYDYNTNSKFTPYVGVGVGVARVSLDYFSQWKRRANPTTFNDEDLPVPGGVDADDHASNLNALNDALANTTSITNAKLSDTLFGYQVIAGVDYRVSDPVTIGLKFRWADFGEFEDGQEWDQLRGHQSAVGPCGAG